MRATSMVEDCSTIPPPLSTAGDRADCRAMDLGLEGTGIARHRRVGRHRRGDRAAARRRGRARRRALPLERGRRPRRSPPRSAASRCRPTCATRRMRTRSCPAAVERSGGSTPAWPTPASGRRRTCRSPQMPLERWRATLDANLTATFLTARAYLRHVAATGAGSLVLVASTAGALRRGGPRRLRGGQGGDRPRARALAQERDRARRAARARERRRARLDGVADDRGRAHRGDGRPRSPRRWRCARSRPTDDIARAIAFLCSPLAAGHVTGQVVTVAGGMEGRLLHP